MRRIFHGSRRRCKRYGDRFLQRIFTEGEIAYCTRRRDPVPHLAGRFAAKEAAMKALGTGHSRGVLWKDIEVVRVGGPPQLQLHGGAARRADEHAGAPQPRDHHALRDPRAGAGHAASATDPGALAVHVNPR